MYYFDQSISIVIPVYKSRDSIPELAKELEKTMHDLADKWEVIFVIDGCPKYSELAVQKVCEGSENFKGLVLARNHGQQYTLLVGLKHAKGDLVITMDDDLQNPTSEIAKLLAAIKDDYQIAIGVPKEKQHNWFRNLSSHIMQCMVSTILDKPRSLKLSSFRCLTKRAVELISQYQGVYPYMPALMFNAVPMHEIINVEVEHERRKVGKSSYTVRQLVKLASFLVVNHSMVLLRTMTYLGTVIAFLSFTAGGFYTIRYLIFTTAPAGWTSLAVLVSILSGFTLVSLGILGEYIGRVIKQTDTDTRYTVYREVGNWTTHI